MGGHHKPVLPKVPDWRIYKVEDVPKLMAVKKALASYGLSDPWLRNEVWKYTEEAKHQHKISVKAVLTSGFKYGLVAAVITTIIEKAFFDPGHGHEHGSEHS